MTTQPAPSPRAFSSTARENSVAGRGRALLDVADVEHGLRREQLQRAPSALLLGGDPRQPRRPTVAQEVERLVEQPELELGLLVPALGLLLDGRAPLLAGVEVGEHELGLDNLRVGQRVDAALHVRHILVLEAAQHVGDRIDLADVREELVAEALALGGPAHEAGNVDEGEPRRDDLLGGGDRGEPLEPRVGTPTSPTLGSIVQNG